MLGRIRRCCLYRQFFGGDRAHMGHMTTSDHDMTTCYDYHTIYGHRMTIYGHRKWPGSSSLYITLVVCQILSDYMCWVCWVG